MYESINQVIINLNLTQTTAQSGVYTICIRGLYVTKTHKLFHSGIWIVILLGKSVMQKLEYVWRITENASH